MNELSFYVRIDVPNDFHNDENYDANMDKVIKSVENLAEEINGTVVDIEIK